MRNNKFRIWAKEPEWMDEVKELSWACDGTISHINGCLADNFILMQSTGLPDRNGKEIFDGDIVEGEKYSGKPGIYDRHIGVVKFRHESFSSFGINQYKGQEAKMNSLFEIVGNIYDNPELLEVTK